jgi:predicted ATPase
VIENTHTQARDIMNIIDNVRISGFWSDRSVAIDFHPDVNFLIGVNGSGKTTVINMIAAVLSADFPTLDRLPFQSINVTLAEVDGRKRPSIDVEKKLQPPSPYPSITFSIRDKATDTPKKYSLHELEEESFYRVPPPEYLGSARFRRLRRIGPGLMEHIKHLVNVSWLSIHRTPAPHRPQEDRSYESSVDQRLAQLSNEFVRYFSLMHKQSTKEMEKFQQTIFLSLLSDESEQKFQDLIRGLDWEKEKESLEDIFRTFKLDESKFSKRVKRHFDAYSMALLKFDKKEGLTLGDLAPLLGTLRIHLVVQEWNKLIEKQRQIFEQRDTFLEVINGLLQQQKKLEINDRNELEAIIGANRRLSLRHLSSGEKQLVIILGEALLQDKNPWIYIADEPELSLHVAWQEGLIRNLRRINPQAQVIFATHSPDIVSEYSTHVFDMQKVIV